MSLILITEIVHSNGGKSLERDRTVNPDQICDIQADTISSCYIHLTNGSKIHVVGTVKSLTEKLNKTEKYRLPNDKRKILFGNKG